MRFAAPVSANYDSIASAALRGFLTRALGVQGPGALPPAGRADSLSLEGGLTLLLEGSNALLVVLAIVDDPAQALYPFEAFG